MLRVHTLYHTFSVWTPALPFPSCATLSKFLNSFNLQIAYLQNGYNSSTPFRVLFGGLIELKSANHTTLRIVGLNKFQFHPIHPISLSLDFFFFFKYLNLLGCQGGSVGWASSSSSGHDLTVCEVEPCIGLYADSSEPGACFVFCLSLLSHPCLHSVSLSLSLSKMNKC